MNTAPQFMEGRYDHKMDPKFRVSIPVDWRPAPGETLRLLHSVSYDLPVVVALTETEYLDRLMQIDEAENLNPLQKRQLKGRLHSKCRPATVNPQGKLLVPKDWSEAAGLPSDDAVTLVGRGTYFEIWNAGNFATVEERETDELASLNDELGVF